jgi:hypothetical protein
MGSGVSSVDAMVIGCLGVDRRAERFFSYLAIYGVSVCWLFIFKVTEPNSIPYRTHSACAKRAAYPDPPPVIPVPDTGVAKVTLLPSPRSLGEPTEFRTWVSFRPEMFSVYLESVSKKKLRHPAPLLSQDLEKNVRHPLLGTFYRKRGSNSRPPRRNGT